MHRFYVLPERIDGQRVRFDQAQAHQLQRVLRMRPGDEVVVFDGSAQEHTVRLDTVNRKQASGSILSTTAAGSEPAVSLTLYQSLLNRDKFEWVLQKGTEIGVARFVPVITNRTLVRDAGAVSDGRLARWRRIVTEAAEQSRRTRVPQVRPAIRFDEAVAEAGGSSVALIAWEAAGAPPLREAMAGPDDPSGVALFIGPEGGYEAAEVELAEQAGVRPFTLGRRILRTETAAVVAAALVLYELSEME